jgi:hypothetical protein
VVANRHAERVGTAGQGLPDPAVSEDAQRGTVHVQPEESVHPLPSTSWPVTFAH